jgi:DNA-directed RNA polymerase subunit RPC12/RpoP
MPTIEIRFEVDPKYCRKDDKRNCEYLIAGDCALFPGEIMKFDHPAWMMLRCDACHKAEVKEEETEKEKLQIRKFLWMNHGCGLIGLYGDDGELQCNNISEHCPIDFKRDSFNDIEKKLIEGVIKKVDPPKVKKETIKRAWIDLNDGSYECSLCKKVFEGVVLVEHNFGERFHFCPHCGDSKREKDQAETYPPEVFEANNLFGEAEEMEERREAFSDEEEADE